MRYVDPTGEDPTETEAIAMGLYSYADLTGKELEAVETILSKGGWTVSTMADDLTLNDESTGLNSIVFERTIDGKTEYAYVYAGTADSQDALCDAAIALGQDHPQISQALNNATEIDNRATEMGAGLTFIGHSLGGFLASNASRVTNRRAMAFNPAGTNAAYNTKLALNQPTNVTNYIIMGPSPLLTDPVFMAGTMVGMLPVGKIVPVTAPGILFPHKMKYFKETNLYKK